MWIHYVRCSHRSAIVVTVAAMTFCYSLFLLLLLPPSCQLYQGIHFSQTHLCMYIDTQAHSHKPIAHARIHIPISPCFCAPSIIAFPAGHHRLGIPSPTFIIAHNATHTLVCIYTFYICPRRSFDLSAARWHAFEPSSLRSVHTHIFTYIHSHMYTCKCLLYCSYNMYSTFPSFRCRSVDSTLLPPPPLAAFEIPKCTYICTNMCVSYVCVFVVCCDSCCLTTRSVCLAVCKSVARIDGRFCFVSWQTENYSHTKKQ